MASTYVAGPAKHRDIVTADGPGSLPWVSVYSGKERASRCRRQEGGFLAKDCAAGRPVRGRGHRPDGHPVAVTQAVQQIVTGGTATVTVAWSTDLPNPTAGGRRSIQWTTSSGDVTPSPIPGS